MSALTFEIPIGTIPNVPIREGMPFRGFFKGGKMHVIVQDEKAEPENNEREKAAREYLRCVREALAMPAEEDAEADPRYAYLYKKHVLCIPSDELF